MLPVLDDPAIRAHAHAISVTDYHRMFDLGMLAPNIELIRGALVEKMPKSPLHASIVTLLHHHLLSTLPPGWLVRSEQPITLADSEPEPDIAIVRGELRDFFQSHPTSAEVVVEVCVSSEAIDRLKLQLYAEAGVRECWLILAEERVVERHTDPEGTSYRQVERSTGLPTLPSTVFPGLTLPPAGLFPG